MGFASSRIRTATTCACGAATGETGPPSSSPSPLPSCPSRSPGSPWTARLWRTAGRACRISTRSWAALAAPVRASTPSISCEHRYCEHEHADAEAAYDHHVGGPADLLRVELEAHG